MKVGNTVAQQCFVMTATFLLAAVILYIRNKDFSLHATDVKETFKNDGYSRRDIIWTARGPATYEEVNQYVFRPNNFKLVEYTYPIPRLDFIQKPSCAKVFQDWLAIARKKGPTNPPMIVGKKDKNDYSLNGYAIFCQQYYNDMAKANPIVWDKFKSMMAAPKAAVGYGKQGLAVLHALRDYPVVNMTGVVIGSQLPWIEVQALYSGATKVHTVEYQEIKVVGSRKIEYIHPIDFAKEWRRNVEKYDFAISFSSMEHSGLGRYGDPVDPIGDLREAQKILCLLKQGGTFYLGIPVGRDSIFFNAHRVYGRLRLAMIMTGFEWLATYRGSDPYSQNRTENDYKDHTDQDLYVLRKIHVI